MSQKPGAVSKCPQCHGVFVSGSRWELTCRDCQRKTWKQQVKRPKGNPPRQCITCGQMFVPQRKNSLTCSPECIKRGQFAILERDNFQCIYCGCTSYGDRAELHLDHVIPYSKGGKDTAGNLATACVDCNLGKNAVTINSAGVILAEVAYRNEQHGIPQDRYIKVRS